jgi:hypothetical protein
LVTLACEPFLNCVIDGKIEGRIEVTGRRGRRLKQSIAWSLGNVKIVKIERGSTRSHFMENSLWKKLWTCNKTNHGNECLN